MALDTTQTGAIAPAFALLPAKMAGKRATVMLLAIGLQESRLQFRRQIGGPARGLWQFEQGGGVRGVLGHASSRPYALEVCSARQVEPTSQAVYEALERDDVLAAAFARLLLWTDPKPLPGLGQVQEAWDLYARVWRPGKPHPQTWEAIYAQALAAVQS